MDCKYLLGCSAPIQNIATSNYFCPLCSELMLIMQF